MIKIANPYTVLAKLGAVAGVALALFGAGYYTASEKAATEMAKQAADSQAKYDAVLSAYNTVIAKDNLTAQGNSTVLAAGVDAIANNLSKENQNAKQEPSKPLVFHSSVACVNASSSPVANNSVRPNTAKDQNGQRVPIGVQGNSNPTVAQGTGDQAVCRLDDATGQALHTITQDGDAAIRQLNAVIDAYNLVQKVGCSVTPATREELGGLLDGTPFEIKDVAPPDTPLFTVDKLKEGVLTVAPYILKAVILP